MKYTQKFWDSVEKVLKGTPKEERIKILKKLDDLANELQETPYPVHKFDLRKVSGRRRMEIRVRMGKYRVIYVVDKAKREIVLAGFLRRDETTYKRS